MPEISIDRLRIFHDRAAAAHAALTAANDRVRYARKDWQSARDAMQLFVDADSMSNRRGKDDIAREQSRLEGELSAKAQALEAAEAAQADTHERWSLASSLANRGRDHAASLGVLPLDLQDL